LHQLVGVVLDEHVVLERGRLALVAVDDEVHGLGLAHHRPLLARLEAGAAPAEDVGGEHLLGDRFRRHRQRLAQALVAAVVEVRLQRPRVGPPDASGDDLLVLGERHQPALSVLVTSRRTRLSVPWGGTSSVSLPARRSSTSVSNAAGVTLPKNRQLTARQGASPHRAMHSTSSRVNSPSAVVTPAFTPSVFSACSSSSTPPLRRQAMLVHTDTRCRPTGSVKIMS